MSAKYVQRKYWSDPKTGRVIRKVPLKNLKSKSISQLIRLAKRDPFLRETIEAEITRRTQPKPDPRLEEMTKNQPVTTI